MIAHLLALGLWAAATEAMPAATGRAPGVTIDPCVQVDETMVRSLVDLELELFDSAPGTDGLSDVVSVRCGAGPEDIAIESKGNSGADTGRTLRLAPVSDGTSSAAREARTRELALAIAEVIRRGRGLDDGTVKPEVRAPAAPSPPVAVTVAATVVSPTETSALPPRWHLQLLPAFEYFSAGQRLGGADLALTRHLAWAFVELRVGGRLGADQALPDGRLAVAALTAGAAAGVEVGRRQRSLSGGLALRAQGYFTHFRVEQDAAGSVPSARLGVFVLAAEPRLALALTPHLSLLAAAGFGAPVHGVTVRIMGTEARSLSGVFFSGNLGASFTF